MLSSALAVAFRLGPLTVRWYGVIICCSMLLALWVVRQEAKREGLDTDRILDLALLVLPAGVIGARAYYVIMHWPHYSQNLAEIPMIWKGGLAIHGGILLALLAIWCYCRWKKISFFRWVDMIVLGVVLAQSVGRWGNYVNAELYGPVIEAGSMWSWVPFQVYAEGAYHHPTFFYEFVWDLLGFFLLMWWIRRKHRLGQIFAGYLIFTAVGRFFIELLRTDMLMLFGVRQCYIVCPLMCLVGLGILLYARHTPLVDVTRLPERNQRKKKAAARKK